MEEMMKNLIGLQNCDTRLKEIEDKKKNGPIRIAKLEETLHDYEMKINAELSEFEKFQDRKRKAEQEIDILESKLEKSNIKLSSIKSNKEYKAALKELSDLEKEKLLLEDEVLESMEQVESHNEKYIAGQAEKENLNRQFEKDRKAIMKELKALEKELATIEKEKSRFCQAIDDALLKRYNFIKGHKLGIAVSPVIGGVCRTCYMSIPPQKYNELKRGDELMECPHCKRIIYWAEDERFEEIAN